MENPSALFKRYFIVLSTVLSTFLAQNCVTLDYEKQIKALPVTENK